MTKSYSRPVTAGRSTESDPRPNEFSIWMDNYEAEMRELAEGRLGRTDDVNCKNEENDVSPHEEGNASTALRPA